MDYKGNNDEILILSDLSSSNCHLLKDRLESGLTIVWSTEQETHLNIDGVDFSLKPNHILCLTEFHKVNVKHIGTARLIKFNRAFYCIADHDNEVSCKGILFFGASQVPEICIPESEKEKFDLLWRMFSLEMKSPDNLQAEMLQMMLKRLIILCTRLYKQQHTVTMRDTADLNIVREFNYLVETHFRTLHKVADYADLLHKSPKTLSNLFAKYNNKSPLQIVQSRIMLEARRLLTYTDKAISDIAYEIGYDDLQSFSRFFKSREGLSPKDFKERKSTEKATNAQA